MPIDPEHRWDYGPAEEFRYPPSTQADLVRDFILARFGLRGLSGPELQWLSGLIGDFLSWAEFHSGRNEERCAATKMIRLLSAIDEKMSSSNDPSRSWAEIAIALGLPSAVFDNLSGAAIARGKGVSKVAVCKSITRFLRVVELPKAFDGAGRNLVFH